MLEINICRTMGGPVESIQVDSDKDTISQMIFDTLAAHGFTDCPMCGEYFKDLDELCQDCEEYINSDLKERSRHDQVS